MGFYHNDLHLGNFLIHKVKPGGFWHYKISDIDIYVKNMGYLPLFFIY
jgi:predicted unusual protein kinase regulating ubiquinone biosynthesis (AarF/ABC1/UbiB family)